MQCEQVKSAKVELSEDVQNLMGFIKKNRPKDPEERSGYALGYNGKKITLIESEDQG